MGRLPADRAAALEALGVEWHPYEAMWAARYRRRDRPLRPPGSPAGPNDHTEADGYRLGQFALAHRMLYQCGTLTADRITALEAVGMIWKFGEHRFTIGLTAARSYHRAHGDLHIPAS